MTLFARATWFSKWILAPVIPCRQVVCDWIESVLIIAFSWHLVKWEGLWDMHVLDLLLPLMTIGHKAGHYRHCRVLRSANSHTGRKNKKRKREREKRKKKRKKERKKSFGRGSDESHFHVSVGISDGQNHKTSVHKPQPIWRERRAEAVSNRGPSAYQPNALPLGQTGSHWVACPVHLHSTQSRQTYKVTNSWGACSVHSLYIISPNVQSNEQRLRCLPRSLLCTFGEINCVECGVLTPVSETALH